LGVHDAVPAKPTEAVRSSVRWQKREWVKLAFLDATFAS
jgi:hypothetical protein